MFRLIYNIILFFTIILVLVLLISKVSFNDILPNYLSNRPNYLNNSNHSIVSIKSQNGITHHFNVEIVSTPKKRAQGLMFRKKLASNRGMLFIMDSSQITSFWMKNTFIPLDIIFINSNGYISQIIKNAQPFSKKNIISNSPVTKVLEINANVTSKLGINVGDRLIDDN